MHGSKTFMQVFLKKWLQGLKHGGMSSKKMSFIERKRAIKLSADIAMAFARDGMPWSHALITNISKHQENKAMINAIFGDYTPSSSSSSSRSYYYKSNKKTRSKKIVRRSLQVVCSSMVRKRRHKKRISNGVAAKILARDLVKKRTKLLRRLIPGGDSMDDFILLDQTFDYIISLQAQVDLMHLLAKVLGLLNTKNIAG